MNKQLRCFIWAVMAIAVLLIVNCSLNYLNLGQDLRSCEQQLAESREHWEKIAEEKEALQADLKTKQDELREARLSLDEATERAKELKDEITQLQNELKSLQQNKPADQ